MLAVFNVMYLMLCISKTKTQPKSPLLMQTYY